VPEKDLRDELTERPTFEKNLTENFARFANLPADQIETVIEDAQRRVCHCLGLVSFAFWQWSKNQRYFMT